MDSQRVRAVPRAAVQTPVTLTGPLRSESRSIVEKRECGVRPVRGRRTSSCSCHGQCLAFNGTMHFYRAIKQTLKPAVTKEGT